MPWYETIANWILEEVAAAILLALIAAAAGGFLSKWYFGRKNEKLLRKLNKRVGELERINRAERAESTTSIASASFTSPAASTAAVPSASTQSVAQANSLADELGDKVEPKMLVELVKATKTEFAAKQVLGPYRGKRVTVSGTIRNVSPASDYVTVSLNLPDELTALLFFSHSDNDSYFAALEPGMQFAASGEVFSAHDSGISLDNCELT